MLFYGANAGRFGWDSTLNLYQGEDLFKN